jgi:hypothetical protein
LQYRVADSQNQCAHTILQTRTARNGIAISGFGLTRAQFQPQKFNIETPSSESIVGRQPHRITGGLAQAGFTSRDKYFAIFAAQARVEKECKPRLRQAAGTLHASGGQRSGQRLEKLKVS